jgi:hypothetical protein
MKNRIGNELMRIGEKIELDDLQNGQSFKKLNRLSS